MTPRPKSPTVIKHIRVPLDVLAWARERVAKDGRTFNGFVIWLLRREMDADHSQPPKPAEQKGKEEQG